MKLITPDEQKRERVTVEQTRKRQPKRVPGTYLILSCGHFTNTAVQEVYSAWRSSPELYLCEICGTEVSGLASANLPAQDDKPPF